MAVDCMYSRKTCNVWDESSLVSSLRDTLVELKGLESWREGWILDHCIVEVVSQLL